MNDDGRERERLGLENEALRQRIAALESEKDATGAEGAARWRVLLDEAPVGIATVGLDKRFLTCNAAFCSFLGYSEQELKQKTISEITHPEDAAIGMAALSAIVAGTMKSSRVEKRYIRKDGGAVWGEVSINLVRNEQGRPLYFMPYILDITERKRAEAALKESVDLLARAGSLARFGGWCVEVATNRCTWSDEVARIHEMPPGYAPLVEDGIRFYAPEWRDKIAELYTACARYGTSYDAELQIITSKGKRVWVRTCGEAFRDQSGKIIRIWGGFQDITERKQAESEIKSQLDELHRWHEAMLGREDRAQGLKSEVNELCLRLGQSVRYPSQDADPADSETAERTP